MPGYGRQLLGTTGYPIMVIANELEEADFKTGGITLDWSKVAAVPSDTLLPEGATILNGQKYLRYGQVLCRINTAEIQNVTFVGGPTTGGVILTLPASGTDPAQSTVSISATATAAVFEAALNALSRIGPGGVSVARSGTGVAGDPYIYAVTFNRKFGDVPALISSSNTFSGGTAPSVSIATATAGTGTGLFGPFDPSATDGRQSLVKGECYILNETVAQNQPLGFGAPNSDNPAVFDAGPVWKARLLVTLGTASLASGPTLAAFETAFPGIRYVQN